MGEYKLSKYEMETTVNFNMEEKEAVLYTRDRVVMRRMDKLVEEFPGIYRVAEETDISRTYRFPKKYALPKRPRVLSEEQRSAMKTRLAVARESQNRKAGQSE